MHENGMLTGIKSCKVRMEFPTKSTQLKVSLRLTVFQNCIYTKETPEDKKSKRFVFIVNAGRIFSLECLNF